MKASCAGTDTGLNYIKQEIVYLHIIFQEERAISLLQTHGSGDISSGAAEALCCITQDFIRQAGPGATAAAEGGCDGHEGDFRVA